ncbi:MAG: NAD(P)-dependent alcohol dehydrogenase [Phycisphaerales bacterium]
MTTKAFAAQAAESPLAPFSFDRREPGPKDVAIEILYCGVCHSDIHQARNEWKNTTYPCVPGHEIVGRVAKVGKDVTKFKEGDHAAVGCMVDSCRTCASCRRGLEQYCETGGLVLTYNGPDKHSKKGWPTFGGYSERIVVDEAFTLRVPEGMDLAATAPLLCAGITTYSPLRQWGAGPGKRVGVVGLGGLGHMGVKIAHAMGAHVTLFTTSPDKVEDGKRLGADEVVVSKDEDAMGARARSLDFLLDTVAANHDINEYLNLLKLEGTLWLVGLPEEPLSLASFSVVMPRRTVTGSAFGGIPETQEMLDFCAEHGIAADIEMIRMQDVNEAYERMIRGDVKYRFVIDMKSLREG